MGRPPCCDKQGVKKGPWTPEEDILLVSYIQQHGPSNWRALPSHAGLQRCSKSCRLRWTNYLRPGIKRGNFSDQEEKMIIHLQALLGNRWAAIASYLPERTDNDIKNYWNTHLQKKQRKLQLSDPHYQKDISRSTDLLSPDNATVSNRGQWERRLQTDIHLAKKALCDAISSADAKLETPLYASNTENIARLLEGWEKKSPKNEASSSVTVGHDSSKLEANTENEALLRSLFGNIDQYESPNYSDYSHETVSPETSCVSEQEGDGLKKLSLLEQWLFDDDHYCLPLQEGIINLL